MIEFADLNRNQRRAVDWEDGPLCVLASPGSGKTAVLTLRIVRLLSKDDQTSALALTFTNNAATEMRTRVEQRIGGSLDRARLCTFHAFAADLLRQHGSHLKIHPGFRLVASDEDRIAVLEEVARDSMEDSVEWPQDRVNLLRLIDRLFAESYDPGRASHRSVEAKPRWLSLLFRRYRDMLVRSNLMDFGGLLHFANILLRRKPMVARLTQRAWDHICVDEFQDTNQAQYDLLRLMAPSRKHNLFVVADDDQIMYQWNGASPRRFSDLRRDYELETILLPENYRCPHKIVKHANRLIALNKTRQVPDREGAAMRPAPQPDIDVVRYKVLDDVKREAEFVGLDVRSRGVAPADCVVLGRTNSLMRQIADGIELTGHAVFTPHPKSNFDSAVLGLLVEALRLANAPHDRVVLRKICGQWERVTGVALEPHAVGSQAALAGGDFLRAWVDSAAADDAGRGHVLDEIRAGLVDGMDFPEMVGAFLDGGWRSWIVGDPDDILLEEAATWGSLHDEILATCGRRATLNAYLHHLDLARKTPQPDRDAIQCMTVHRSKGLQFKHVYLVGMAQGEFPRFQALRQGPGSSEMQEERRNCFVAITRAQSTLTLTRAREYGGRPKPASQFLGEMGWREAEEDGSARRGA